MTALAQKSDYYDEAIGRLLSHFQDKPRILAIVQSYITEIQELEDASWYMYYLRLLQNGQAYGDLLDKIGAIVGQARDGADDATYTVYITARIKANRSSGRREELIEIAKLLIPSVTMYVKDYAPASLVIEPQGTVTGDPYLIGGQFLAPAVMAGVLLMFIWTAAARTSTIIGGSIYTPSFSAGPPATNTGVTSSQSPGSIYNTGFTTGPPCTNTGGGVLCGVIQSDGET